MANKESIIRRNIIPKMRRLVYQRFTDFENELNKLTQKALDNFNRFLMELDSKIIQLERKSKRFF